MGGNQLYSKYILQDETFGKHNLKRWIQQEWTTLKTKKN